MAGEKISVLIHAVRVRVVLKYCGQLALMLALLTLAPLGFALVNQDWILASRFLEITGILLLGGGLSKRLTEPSQIQTNEALTTTALAFLCSALLMTWPLMAAGISFTDALFESVSGVTTTGLSTLASVEELSPSFLFARAWMQWFGGLGIVVLSVALLMGNQAAARRLIEPTQSGGKLMAAARTHARHGLIVYVSLTMLGLGLVGLLSGNWFTALVHVLSAVSTGGFSSYNTSLGGLMSRPAAIAVMAVCFLSAVSLPLYWQAAHAGWRTAMVQLFKDVELRALLLLCLLAGGVLGGLNWLHGLNAPWYHGLMTGFSAQTTTGFAVLPVDGMDPASKAVMILSMLIGGSVGSSAGGFKLLRLLILLRLSLFMVQRTAMPPHAVANPWLAGHKLKDDDLIRALQLIVLFLIILVLSWLPFVAMGYEPLDALFEVASACGTVGLSSGIVRPELETWLKAILCFDMLAGRVEIIALLIILYPHNWFGRREELT